MDDMPIMPDVYNRISKSLAGVESEFKTLEAVHKLATSGIPNFQIDGFASMVTEFQSVLSAVHHQLLPFETLSSCIQTPSLNDMLFTVQNSLKMPSAINLVNEHIHQRFSDLLNETVDNIPLDEEAQFKFKDLMAKVKTLTFTQIFNFIVGIITLLSFVQSCSPNEQLEESNDLQRQQIQESQRTNELLAEQNELIKEANSLDRARSEQLNKVIELREQYIELLLDLEERSVQVVDDADQ